MKETREKPEKKKKREYVKNGVSSDVASLAREVIANEKKRLDPDIGLAKIDYFCVTPNVSPTVAAVCIRSSRLVKFYGEVDYVIAVSEEVWEKINDQAKRVLVLHELKHIGIKFGKDGNPRFGLRRHDVNDFYDILKDFGTDWLESVRSAVQISGDFQNGEENLTQL